MVRTVFSLAAILAVIASGIVLHRDVQLATYYMVCAVAMKLAAVDRR